MKVAVIGAGPAGLAAAWELKTHGVAVDVFEAHSKPGGCASYFRRSLGGVSPESIQQESSSEPTPPKVLFDAGATVLWSLREGDFFSHQLKRWGVKITPFSTHPLHRFYIANTHFELDCRTKDTWVNSLVKCFPQDKIFIQEKFPLFFKISELLNRILYKVPAEPFLSIETALENIKMLPEALELGRYFLQIPRNFSTLLAPCSDAFKEWANSFLLITLQACSQEVESLYGISALCFFPLGAGSLEGGMASLFGALSEQLVSATSNIYFKSAVHKISAKSGYEILCKDKSYSQYSHVLLSTPRWNSLDLFEEKLFRDPASLEWENIQDKLWTAVVSYLVFKDDNSLPESAFNHLVKTEDGEFYFSVSKRGDVKRGPSQCRVVTASTHERLGQWNYSKYQKKKAFEGREVYEEQKKRWEKSFIKASSKVFSSDPLFSEIGSPNSFFAYTLRKEGFVGGIPLTKDFAFLKSPSQETLLPNVYQIGDTAFPGQSIVNCSVGAIEAVRKILRSL